ncbi:MAG: hypothetical protein O4803_09060 [Trichodesmium sp. St15_bin1_1]|nr:hypothetical protein [Trichodesmium sp. St18_bin1]MDE5086907.1 hypothetical protein [Trichodesmium sp. St16_bin2-tuft]MDE5114386.1 hypothetical protein [Trichodesmium sp. St15_bin1_1]MDE5121935.1 hypothetical protein [Trichodesmium sp. St19_bin1]
MRHETPPINRLEYLALISPDFYSSPAFTYRVELLEKAEESSTKSIPEASATFGLLTLGICGLVKGKK